jgi:hypothetical protein
MENINGKLDYNTGPTRTTKQLNAIQLDHDSSVLALPEMMTGFHYLKSRKAFQQRR